MSSTDTDLNLRGLVHDLNNVFQTLLDAADALSEDSEWAPVAGAIHRSVEHGQRLARSIIQAGVQPTAETFDVSSIVEVAVQYARDFAKSTHRPPIEFRTAIQPGLFVSGNKVSWERLFVNLLLNSLQAMPKGGVVDVEALYRADAILIRLCDNGPGIPAKILPRIFEPHFSTKPSNSGLGLHIVRTIADENGASVTARNLEEGGAEFVIAIPGPAILKSDDEG